VRMIVDFECCWMRNLVALKRITLMAVLLGSQPLARADIHWTTNGTHMGVLLATTRPGTPAALDGTDIRGGHNVVGRFTLAYARWTLGGEPVHEFIFTWSWRGTNLIVARAGDRAVTSGELAKYPDLSNLFSSLKPSSMTLEADIEFYDSTGVR